MTDIAPLPLVFEAHAKPEGPHVKLGPVAQQSHDAAVIALACTAVMVARAHPDRHPHGSSVLELVRQWLQANPGIEERTTPAGIVLPHGLG